jgi:Skp family chaperone for outer membrane proteins
MKKQNIIFVGLLVVLLAAFVCIEKSCAAKDKTMQPPKIAIVSVRELFDSSTLKTQTEKELSDAGEKRLAELKNMEQEIEADKNALSKLKTDSPEYMTALKALMFKQSQYEAGKEYCQQELTLKEMRGKELIYRQILEAIKEVAQDRDRKSVV